MNKFYTIVFTALSLFLSPIYAEKLVIGTLKYNPPFEVDNNGVFFGFEIELMQDICKRINATCEFKGLQFHELPIRLATHDINLAIGTIIITPERKKKFLFSLPYKESFLQYIVRKDATYKQISELKNKTIGAYFNSPAIANITNQFNNQVKILSFPYSMDMLLALNQKKVDAVVTNFSQANYWIANNPNIKLLGKKFIIGEGYGIMTNFQNQDLISRINKVLISMEKDGTYLKIYENTF